MKNKKKIIKPKKTLFKVTSGRTITGYFNGSTSRGTFFASRSQLTKKGLASKKKVLIVKGRKYYG